MSRSVSDSLRVSRADRSSWYEPSPGVLPGLRGAKYRRGLGLAHELRYCVHKAPVVARGADPTACGIGSPKSQSLPRRISLQQEIRLGVLVRARRLVVLVRRSRDVLEQAAPARSHGTQWKRHTQSISTQSTQKLLSQ